MKNIFFPLIVCLLVMASSASAGLLPQQITGKVVFDGVTYANQEVEITNTRLGYTWVRYTNENGVYEITFNDLEDDIGRKSVEGDTIEIVACPVEVNSDCKKVATVSEIPQRIDWGIDDSNAQDLISDGAIPSDEAKEQQEQDAEDNINYCGDCVCTPTNCPDLICPTPGECSECSECDSEGFSSGDMLMAAILSIIASGGVIGTSVYYAKRGDTVIKGVTLKTRVGTDGKITHTHYHRGIRNYHSVHTSHSDIKERHARDELYPEYVKNEEGKYVYVPPKK